MLLKKHRKNFFNFRQSSNITVEKIGRALRNLTRSLDRGIVKDIAKTICDTRLLETTAYFVKLKFMMKIDIQS